MPRLLCAAALLPLLGLLPGLCRSADDVKPFRSSAYFPLEVGTTWHYRAGEARFKVKVTKHEKIGDVMAAKLETYGDKDKLISDEHVAVLEDTSKNAPTRYHAVRVASRGERLTPPLPFLKLPKDRDEKEWKALEGLSWTFASKVGGKEIKGALELRSVNQEVTVPAGKYRTVVVEGKSLEVLGNKLTLSYQFAEGVGMVKQTMELGGQKIVVELEKFEKGK